MKTGQAYNLAAARDGAKWRAAPEQPVIFSKTGVLIMAKYTHDQRIQVLSICSDYLEGKLPFNSAENKIRFLVPSYPVRNLKQQINSLEKCLSGKGSYGFAWPATWAKALIELFDKNPKVIAALHEQQELYFAKDRRKNMALEKLLNDHCLEDDRFVNRLKSTEVYKENVIRRKNMITWKFTPYNLEKWNDAEERVMFVASEPNGENPNGNVFDMGHWFRNAERNNFYNNKRFFTRCEYILRGIAMNRSRVNIFDNFRFMDLKATQGGNYAVVACVRDYVKNNMSDVVKYFDSCDETFGISPNIIVLLGNPAQFIFTKYIRSKLLNSRTLQWVGMPHPSNAVGYEGLKFAAGHIRSHLKPISELAEKWVYRKDNYNIWKPIV